MVEVDGIGAVKSAVPPVALLPYQSRLLPLAAVALIAVATVFKQKATSAVVGADGTAFMITTIFALGLSQAVLLFF